MDDKLAASATGQGSLGGGPDEGGAQGAARGGVGGTDSTDSTDSTDGTGTRAGGPLGGGPSQPPSKPWLGGLILACLALAAVWVLTYTLAPLPGQRSLGGWNYVLAGALLTAFVSLSKAWQGEPPQRSADAKKV